MSWILDFYRSAIGKKAIMATTGLMLFGFVLAHMVGNLKLYLGPEALDHYAVFLREAGYPLLPKGVGLWIARIGLLTAAILHILSAWQLTMMNRAARPHGYAMRESVTSTYAARTMRWGGVIVLLFVIYHVMHLTLGTVHPDFREGEVYHNVVAGFRVLPAALFYILANIALGFHLDHGLWSMFQSLGLNHPKFNPWRRNFARVFALVVTAGNVSFPLAVLSGLVQ